LLFQKNIAFTKIIKSGGRPREFNFRRKKVADHFEYDIDSGDDRGERYYFTCFKKENGDWAVQEKILPAWVIEALPQIAEILQAVEAEVL
jgi:hypothetical protein